MYCSKCGYELQNDEDFCPKCGTKVRIKDDLNENEENKDEKKKDKKNGEKKKFPILIVVIAVLILIIILLLINFNLFRRKIRNSGHFEKIDGIDTYVENGEIVTNSLVRIRGKKIYFVDEKGHKKKNTWEIIDNDGTYGYFGSMGELVKNKIREIDGKNYYFDENGKLIISTEVEVNGIKYKANSEGELYTLDEYKEAETKISETVLAKITPTTQATTVAQTVPPTQIIQTAIVETTTQYVAPSYIVIGDPPINQNDLYKGTTEVVSPVGGNPIVEGENGGPGIGLVDTYKKSYAVDDKNIDTDYEDSDEDVEQTVRIKSTEKITDTIDDDEYECKLTFVKPIMQGKNSEETEMLNETIDELMDVLWDEVESLINDYSSLPKSVTFSTPTLGTVSSSKILINLSGSIVPRSGSSKSIKYRITYDREEGNGDIVKTS